MDTDLLKKLGPFFREYSPLNYKKGQIIVRPEDKVNHIYFIEKGFVKFYSLSEEGKELTFLIYKPGYLFPAGYAFLGNKTKYYFEALTPLLLRRAPRAVFLKLMSQNPNLIYSINQEIVMRFDEILNRMEFLATGSAGKNVSFIILLFANQFGKKIKNGVSINLPIGHKDIASMAGLARETVSLEMKKLEDKGLISYRRNNISIRDLQKFKKQTGLYF